MRPTTSSSIAYSNAGADRGLSFRWLQAGLTGFAYRLAHLTLPKPVAFVGTALLFYMV